MEEKTIQHRELFNRLTYSSLVVMVAICAGILIWLAFYFRGYEGLLTSSSFDQAQVARRVALGDGFTTGLVTPLSLNFQEGVLFPPEFYNSPAYVYFLAWFFGNFGLSDEVVLASSLSLGFLAGIAVFIFCWLKTRELVWSCLVFLIFMTALGTLEYVFSPSSVSLLSLLLLLYGAAFYFFDRRSAWQTVALGAAAGLLYLAEFDYLFMALPAGFWVVRAYKGEAGKFRAALSFAAGFILAASPLLVRNAAAAGNPLFSLRWHDFLIHTRTFPGNRLIRDYGAASAAAAVTPAALGSKLAGFLRLGHRYWLSYSHLLVTPFFLVSGFIPSADRRWGETNRMLLTLFFVQLGLIAAGNGALNNMLAFTPVMVLSGTAVFRDMLYGYFPRQRIIRRACVWTFFAAAAAPGLLALARGLPDQRYISTVLTGEEAVNLRKSESLEHLMGLVRDNEVIVSDIPWAVAWYANRAALWLPWEVEHMRVLKEEFPEIRFIYLSPVLFRYPEIENTRDWASIYRSGMVPEWLQVDRGLLLPGDDLILGDIILERLDLE